MPKLSEFYGIRITMYAKEHGVPHFHASYAGEQVVVSIATLAVISGSIRARGLAMVIEWAALHREELLEAWSTLRRGGEPRAIAPL
jgi:hypothetical protein